MNIDSPKPAEVQKHVEAIRHKLLDLSLNNRLLNFRASKKSSIEIIGEDSTEIHRIIVTDAKRMSFVGTPDPPKQSKHSVPDVNDFGDEVSVHRLRQDAIEELDGYLANPVLASNITDLKLSTKEPVSILDAKLRYIERESKLAEEELGINTLFLALGFLEWVDVAGKVRKAPLVFVPVKLDKQNNGTLRVLHDGGDVGTNLPLEAKLRESGLSLPTLDEDKSLAEYFSEVAATILRQENWSVLPNEVHLAFFNYEKFIMWHDLGGDNWPEGRKPWQHDQLIRILSGTFEHIRSGVNEQTSLDSVRPPETSHEVFDADSSQVLVLIRAREGHSLVVQGPPGTGKSQTITNIIAEAVANSKSVLFVSAKRAALDVVKRKLGESDLQDLCLDLHDKLTNRRAFYAELKRTAALNLRVQDQQGRIERLKEIQLKLNGHADAVNSPISPHGITPFGAMVALADLPAETSDDREGRIPFENLAHLSPQQVEAAKPAIESLRLLIKKHGCLGDNPFYGCQLSYIDPGLWLDLQQALATAKAHVETAVAAIAKAAETFRIDPPQTSADVAVLLECAQRANAAPFLDGVAVNADTWANSEAPVRRVIEALEDYQSLRPLMEANFIQPSLRADLGQIARAFREYGTKFHRFLIAEFRTARRQVSLHLTPGGPTDALSITALLEDHLKYNSAAHTVEQNGPLLERLFGVQYRGLETRPDVMRTLIDWVLSLQLDVQRGALPKGLLQFFTGFDQSDAKFEEADAANVATNRAVGAYRNACQLVNFKSEQAESESLINLRDRIAAWEASLPQLPSYLSLMEATRHVVEKSAGAVLAVAESWELAGERLTDSFLRSYYSGVLRIAITERPELRTFERTNHEAAVKEFQQLDDFKLKYNRARIRLVHLSQLPDFAIASGNLMLLRTQCELQRKHRSIRWAMEKAGPAIQKIKPVFMMSPLSVAIHLPPELPLFDIVIFDEASQIKPEDALCSIIRAKQAVVVGDTKQMPPTSFFDRLAEGEDEVEPEDEATLVAAEASKLESILSMMSVVAADPARRPDLRWHYRSLHQSLIQPSNELFYDNRLVIFPSSGRGVDNRQLGIRLHYDPTTAYVQGKRTNPKEAQLVANAVIKHLNEHPDESLLVAAMNKSQADFIYDEVEILRRENPGLFARYDQRFPHEPLSIKNLENVQGDERDIVFVSVTYGRDEAGIIRQQFGPLLQDGGERRLNVLITRARLRCEVFTNMRSGDLRVDPGRRGLVVLQSYLKYAETGQLEVFRPTGADSESPFEDEVRSVLVQHGYEVDTQVGSVGYRIDLGVIDPSSPGEYLLGIECDGATYHSARSARDRDKLRQRILESRGWVLHRIWSTDWWQNRDGEVRRLLEALDDLRKGISREHQQSEGTDKDSDTLTTEAIEDFVQELKVTRGPTFTPQAYPPTPPISVTDWEQLEQVVVDVVRLEGPITEHLLIDRLRSATGWKKTGSKLRAEFEAVIGKALRERSVHLERDAYVTDPQQCLLVRDWSSRGSERKGDNITDVELLAALAKVVKASYGVSAEAAASAAWRQLGFARVSSQLLLRGTELLVEIEEEGHIDVRDHLIFPKA